MRICLDVRFRTESGSSSYIRQLVPRIIDADPGADYWLLKYPEQVFEFEAKTKGSIICPSSHGLAYMLWTIFSLPLRLRDAGIDVYHAMKLPGPFRVLPGTSVVTTIHSITANYKGYFPRELKMRLFHLYADPALQQSAAVIAVSRFLLDYVENHMKMPAERLHVIHNGVDAVFSPQDDATVAAIRRKFETGHDYLLCVGNVFPVKNHETAVRALVALGNGYMGNLVIAGGRHNEHFETVRALAAELGVAHRVKFIGMVDHADLAALMTGARVLMMPSLTEGFGLAMIEAFRCGLPAIASNVGSLGEVGEGVAIFVDDPYDHEGFAARLRDYLSSPTRERELRKKAAEKAAEFTWEKAAKDHVRVYHSVAP